VRYAVRRFGGLDETGERGNDPNYRRPMTNAFCGARSASSAGYARWTGPLIAAALGDVGVQYVWRFLRATRLILPLARAGARATIPLRRQGGRGGRPLHEAAENALVLAVDEKPSIPGVGALAGLPENAERPGADGPVAHYIRPA